MRYAQIRSMDISNGENVGVSIFVQGCPFHCKGCFNQETWNFDGGKEFTRDVENKFLKLVDRPHIKRVSILGGEPLCKENAEGVLRLIAQIPEDKEIWIYTGYTYETLTSSATTDDLETTIWRSRIKDILNAIDVLVDGQYIEELRDLSLKFRGSSNQRIIYLKDINNVQN